jgi:rhodanese-related sulfurtransferase
VTAANAVALFGGYDVVVDGTDRFSARYLNNDAAFFARRPLVYGSVFKFEGQVAVFHSAAGGPCYRCLFPAPPAAGAVPGCGEAGVLGALCGVIGSLQALECLKLLGGFGEPLIGRVLVYDALRQDFHTLALARDPGCPLCGDRPRIRAVHADTDAEEPAGVTPAAAPQDDAEIPLEVSVAEAHARYDKPNALLIDVREPYELQICHVDGATHIPMRQIPERLETLPRDKHLLILCHSGGRSLRVTEFLRAHGFAAVSNVAGGIDAWAAELDPNMRRY